VIGTFDHHAVSGAHDGRHHHGRVVRQPGRVTLLSRGRGLIVTAVVDCATGATVDIETTLSRGAASGHGHAVEWYPRGLTPLSVTVDAQSRVSQPFSGELLAYRRAGSTKDTP
jgi:hypothetical protein